MIEVAKVNKATTDRDGKTALQAATISRHKAVVKDLTEEASTYKDDEGAEVKEATDT